MKNDIDSLLEAMFRNGKLNLKGAEKEKTQPEKDSSTISLTWDPSENTERATKAAAAVEKSVQRTAIGLNKSIEQLTKDTQADLADLEQHLKTDGMESKTAKNGGNPADIEAAFSAAQKAVCDKVLGQDEFVAALTIAFKRPFVVGSKAESPLGRVAVIGKNGTGRHSALREMTSALAVQGVIKSPKLAFVDLSRYGDSGTEKLFVQDIYAAVKSGASGLVFENYEACHASLLPMVTQLFTDGSIALSGRYAEQKGMLVDIGNALVPNAVAEISAAGKYLFLLTDKSEAKLADAFGAPFVSNLDDVVKLSNFTDDNLNKIAKRILQALVLRCVNQLNFTITATESAAEALAASFNAESGVEAIEAEADKLYRVISEEKLRQKLPAEGELFVENSELCVVYTGVGETVRLTAAGERSDSAKEAAISAVKNELAEIVGLDEIKEYILSLEDNFKIQQLRRERGLKSESPAMHMIFTGNPGTGKTTVARIVSRYLKAIGVLSGGQLVEVTRADLVGKYVGHTAPLTAKAIESAIGGVLFIDEAYSLFRGKDDSFGLEAIDTLVKGMEDNRSNLLVILAGYSYEMEQFLTANSGLRSRFPNIIEFPDYTADELFKITESIVKSKGYRLDAACKSALLEYYDKMQKLGDPRTNGNGRMARNKVEEAVLNCSRRNVKLPEEQQDLELLLPTDFELETE